MGAACIKIKGGFEGLGEPELDEQNKKPMRASFLEQITQHLSHSQDSQYN